MTRDQWLADEGPETEPRLDDINIDDECQVCCLIECECTEPECIHGRDLFVHCVECAAINDSYAADGGEGEREDMANEESAIPGLTGFALPLGDYTPMQLVSMRNAIDVYLRGQREWLRQELAATEKALNGTKPRAKRSDAGRARAAKGDVPRNGEGVAV